MLDTIHPCEGLAVLDIVKAVFELSDCPSWKVQGPNGTPVIETMLQ